MSEEKDRHRLVYVGGDKLCSFLTDDDTYKYISNMGNNFTPYSIAIGEKNISFWTPHSKFIKKKGLIMINYWMQTKKVLINMIIMFQNCKKHLFKTLRIYKIHSSFI